MSSLEENEHNGYVGTFKLNPLQVKFFKVLSLVVLAQSLRLEHVVKSGKTDPYRLELEFYPFYLNYDLGQIINLSNYLRGWS